MGHYDTDIHCDECGKYMFSFYHTEDDSGVRTCAKCAQAKMKFVPKKQKLYLVHLEPLSERYTESWYRNLPKAFDEAGYDVVQIIGRPLVEDDIKVGAFLDINSTAHYKSTQLQKIARMFNQGKIEQNSIFFFSDIEFWGIEQVRLLADMNQVKVFLTGFLHAASYTKDDAFAIAAPYQRFTEVGWIAALDQVYVGSKYHKQAVIDRRLAPVNASELGHKIFVTKNPMFATDYPKKGLNKEKLMLLTNRFDKEKDPMATCRLFHKLKQKHPDWNFVITTGRKTFRSNLDAEALDLVHEWERQGILEVKAGLTKAQYHEYLERAAIVVSHSPEENYGICIAESLVYGCAPLLLNCASHPEHVHHSQEFLFDNKFTHDYDLAERLMFHFERNQHMYPGFDWSGMDNIIKAMSKLQ